MWMHNDVGHRPEVPVRGDLSPAPNVAARTSRDAPIGASFVAHAMLPASPLSHDPKAMTFPEGEKCTAVA